MGCKQIDLTDKRFGRLTVIKFSYRKGQSYWLCKCDCGNEKIIRYSNLTMGETKSCGCMKKEFEKISAIKHGDYGKPLYKIWHGIKCGCNVKSSGNYSLYGGRGIKICDEWLDFINFKNWSMENGYEQGLSIDRIDVNGNYEPNNCRWVISKVQDRNKRRSRIVEYRGETKHIYDWCEELELNKNTVSSRYDRGLRGDDLFKK